MSGIIFLIWSIFCQNPSHSPATQHCPLVHVVTTTTEGDGGETGHVPPIPPPPPPPPPPIP